MVRVFQLLWNLACLPVAVLRGMCQFSKRYEHFNTEYCALETLRNLTRPNVCVLPLPHLHLNDDGKNTQCSHLHEKGTLDRRFNWTHFFTWKSSYLMFKCPSGWFSRGWVLNTTSCFYQTRIQTILNNSVLKLPFCMQTLHSWFLWCDETICIPNWLRLKTCHPRFKGATT